MRPPTRRRAALAGLFALLLAACAPMPAAVLSTPTPPPTPARLYPLPRLASPEYGIQAFLWWQTDNKTGARDADLVAGLGFGWLKQQFSWRNISGSRGGYDWFRPDGVVALAEARGLRILARLDGTPFWAVDDPALLDHVVDTPPNDPALFAEFCGALAGRYVGRIAAYEVWNEPNLAREWGNQPPDPAAYLALLKPCYLAIKAADPHAIVISAGLAPTDLDDPAVAMADLAFYRGLYEAGGAPYFDLLGAHAPGYGNAPERSPAECRADAYWQSSTWCFRHVEEVRALMLAYGDADKQIAITEMGWTTDTNPAHTDYNWYAVDQATQADYLVRAYQYAQAHWSPWIGLMSMVYIADQEWTEANEQYWWAITRPTAAGDPAVTLPAYAALAAMEK
ncbi:MAG: cellulase family glycosylhydrolase [Anaerolineales bacterium]|nr:cellulase family glycosylhydrolase [Anaerolineales bacterium]